MNRIFNSLLLDNQCLVVSSTGRVGSSSSNIFENSRTDGASIPIILNRSGAYVAATSNSYYPCTLISNIDSYV
jgi:hypothetical protein